MLLKELMKEKGIKQLDVAKQLEISESHISLLLRGKRRMNVDQAHMFSRMMDMSMDEFYETLKQSQT